MLSNLLSSFCVSEKVFNFVPQLQSHRGLRDNGAVENTLAALQRAYQADYEMIEFDLHITKDGKVVLHHDDDVNRSAIKKSRYSDLVQNKKIDLFEDVLRWFITTKKLKFNLELKTAGFDFLLETAVLKLLDQYNVYDRVLVSSFNPISLYFFRKKAPDILRALLVTLENHPSNRWYLKKMWLNVLARPNVLHLREQDWEFIRDNYSVNVPIVLWTCNDLNKAKKYFNEAEQFKKIKDKKNSQVVFGIISDEIIPKKLI